MGKRVRKNDQIHSGSMLIGLAFGVALVLGVQAFAKAYTLRTRARAYVPRVPYR